jgi:hypothetical protein
MREYSRDAGSTRSGGRVASTAMGISTPCPLTTPAVVVAQ